MLCQLVLTKFFKSELFSRLSKVDHVITVMQRAYLLPHSAKPQIKVGKVGTLIETKRLELFSRRLQMPYKMTPFHRRDCVLLLKNKLKVESGSMTYPFSFSLILRNCIETKQSFVY